MIITPVWIVRLMAVNPFKWRKPPGPETATAIAFATELRALTIEGRLAGIWTHIPNEIGWGKNKSNQMVYAIAKNMGMITGFSDYIFTRPGQSLCLEAKSKTGVANPAQKDFKLWCEREDVPYHVFRTAGEGLALLQDYGFIKGKQS